MKVNNMLSAYKKLTDFNKTYKNTKRIYQDMQEVYFKYKFKDGVFCPSSEIYTIAPIFLMERERRGMGNKVVSHTDERQLSLLTYFWGLHVFGTWRNTLGVYRVDPDIFEDIIRSPIPEATPSNIFKRLPDWCVYFDMPKEAVTFRTEGNKSVVCDGFWAVLDYDYDANDNHQLVLNIILNVQGKTDTIYDTYQPIRLLIDDGLTVEEAYEKLFIRDFIHNNKKDNERAKKDMQTTKRLLMSLLSMLLWLCVEEPDISNIKGEPISREDIKKTGVAINKKSGRFVPPSTPVVRELGKRLGGEVRQYRDWVAKGKPEGEKSFAYKVKPHIRRGHFHGYWKGSGQNKQFEVKWRYATFVNFST